jgi:hypothetical protein
VLFSVVLVLLWCRLWIVWGYGIVNVTQVRVGTGCRVLGRILQSVWIEDCRQSRCAMLVELVSWGKNLRCLVWVYVIEVGFPLTEFVRWGRCARCIEIGIEPIFSGLGFWEVNWR